MLTIGGGEAKRNLLTLRIMNAVTAVAATLVSDRVVTCLCCMNITDVCYVALLYRLHRTEKTGC